MAANHTNGNRADQQIAIAQDEAFAESSLPRTMALARDLKAILFRKLNNTPAHWPYEDKVVGWLLPTMIGDIRSYHGAEGPALARMFKSNAVEHLDNDLYDKLATAVERSYPGLVKQLQQFTAATRRRKG